MQPIKKIICSCGGEPYTLSTTEEERDQYGCPQDSKHYSCCVEAFECPNCKTRWTFAYEAPEL